MKNVLKIAKEDLLHLLLNPMWIFFTTAFPVLLIIILGYLTKSNYEGSITSYDYYGITLILYGILNSGMIAANSFMEERIKKPNMRIIYAPGSTSSIFLSKIIASFVFSFFFHMLDLLFVHTVFHVHLGKVGLLLLLFGMTELLSVTLGIMICCIVKTEACANQIQSIAVNLLAALGGLLFSLDGFGSFAKNFSKISPVKWIVEAAFQMIYDNDLHLFGPTILLIIAVIVAMLFVCQKTFRKENCIC